METRAALVTGESGAVASRSASGWRARLTEVYVLGSGSLVGKVRKRAVEDDDDAYFNEDDDDEDTENRVPMAGKLYDSVVRFSTLPPTGLSDESHTFCVPRYDVKSQRPPQGTHQRRSTSRRHHHRSSSSTTTTMTTMTSTPSGVARADQRATALGGPRSASRQRRATAVGIPRRSPSALRPRGVRGPGAQWPQDRTGAWRMRSWGRHCLRRPRLRTSPAVDGVTREPDRRKEA